MPAKRSHKKSRKGCNRCRERRVKCDESSPQCSVCLRRNETCEYPQHPHSYTNSSTQSQSTLGSPTGSNNASELENVETDDRKWGALLQRASFRLNELYLMHHWCTRTCDSFTPEFAELCREHVPREAFRHSYLMNALLAITTLHIATERQEITTTSQRLSAALQYQIGSLADLQKTLHDISPDNVDAVVLSSIFLMICSVLSPLLPAASGEEVRSTAEVMIPLIHFMESIGAIVNKNRQWLQEGPLRDWFRGTGNAILRLDRAFPLAGFQLLNMVIFAETDTASIVYCPLRKAVESLEQAYYQGRSMLRWLSAVEPEFLEELHKEKDAALAIFMYWGVLLDQANDMWWARYSGKRLVQEISMTLDDRREEWKELTHWCRERVGLLDQVER